MAVALMRIAVEMFKGLEFFSDNRNVSTIT